MENTKIELLEQIKYHARILTYTNELQLYFKSYESPYSEDARGMMHAELFILKGLCEKLDTALDGEEALE